MDVVILKNKLTKFFKAQSALTAPASIDSTVDSWAAIIQYATTLSKVLQNISKTASSAGFLYNDGRGNFDYKLVSTDGGSNTGVISQLSLLQTIVNNLLNTSESLANKVTSIGPGSNNTQYPSAAAVEALFQSLTAAIGGRYVGILNQSGTSDPTVILEPVNTLGDEINWSRVGPVTYQGSPGIAYTGILELSSNAFAVDGSTDIWMRDTTDLLGLQILDTNTVQIVMAADGDLTNRRIEIMTSKAISNILGNVLSTVLTGLSFYDPSIVTAADTILKAIGKLQAQLLNTVYTTLTGLSTADATPVTSTDSILSGIGKLQAQINNSTARVLATVLSGLSLLTGGAIVSTDTVLIALGKLQNQISAVLSVVLTGLSTSSATAITATDSILVAFGKLQAQINNSTGGGFYWMPAFVPPVLADFAWVNQGGGSANNNGGIIFLYSPADSNSENLKCLVKGKTGQYTLDMFFIPTFRNISYNLGGLVLRDSVSGKCIRFTAWQQSGYISKLGVTYLNSPTSIYLDKIFIYTYYGASMIAFKIVVTSTTISYYYSFDCLNYILLFSDALNAWGTIDQIGLCCQALNTTDPAAISCVHWKES